MESLAPRVFALVLAWLPILLCATQVRAQNTTTAQPVKVVNTTAKPVPALAHEIPVLGGYPMLADTATPSTFVVGNCKPGTANFSTISDAVSSSTVPAGSTVEVCPSTYNEQVQITKPLTLEGIAQKNSDLTTSDQVIIAPPLGGLAANTTDDLGQSTAAQLWVDNVPGGPVNIGNITIDGTGNRVTSCPPLIVGVFYQNSSGTVNRVAARNQKGNGCGRGIQAEGGTASPTVTIENSSVHDVDDTAILTETNSTTPELTSIIKANDTAASPTGIHSEQGTNNTVSSNFVSATDLGILSDPRAAGSISGNTVMNTPFGIDDESDGVSVTANKVFNSEVGIMVDTNVPRVENNIITNSSEDGIDLLCNGNPNAINNTINEARTGIAFAPMDVVLPNTFFNVTTIRSHC